MKKSFNAMLFILAFMFQACEFKQQKAETTEVENSPPAQLVESKPISTQNSAPTADVVDEFYSAIFNNNKVKVKEMLKTSFPANYQPKGKIPPLQAVIWETDDVDLAKLLIDGGANINDKENPAVLVASEYKRLAILKYLIENGADFKDNGAFSKAGFYQFYEGAKFLLLKGANPDDGDLRGKLWVFHRAIELSDYEVLNALNLSQDNLNDNDCDGKTALIAAIKNNDVELVKYLIKKGVDKNKPETFDCGDDIHYGKKPIQIARENNFEEIIKLLK